MYQSLFQLFLLLGGQWFAIEAGQAEKVLDPLTESGDFGGVQRQPALLENGTDPGQQAGGIEGSQLHQGVTAFPFVGQKDHPGRYAELAVAPRQRLVAQHQLARLLQRLLQRFLDGGGAVGADGLAAWLQYHEGIEHIVAARVHDLGVVDVKVLLIQRRGHGGKQIRRVAAVDKHLAAAAGRVFADDHQRCRIVAMLDDVAAVPGDLFRAVAQEVVGLEIGPELVDRFFRYIPLRKQLLGLTLVFANAQPHVGRVLQPLAQRLLGREVELPQQGALPVVPQGIVGGADIGHGKAVEQV